MSVAESETTAEMPPSAETTHVSGRLICRRRMGSWDPVIVCRGPKYFSYSFWAIDFII